MNLAIESIGWTLLHSLWEGTLIWLALRAILVLLAHRSAKARCLAGCAALALAVLAFGVTFVRVESIGRGHMTAAAVVHGAVLRASPEPASGDAIPAGQAGLQSGRSMAGAVSAALPWLVLFWAAGCAWGSVKMALGWRTARRLASTLWNPAPAWLEVRCRELSAQLGVGRMVRIGESLLVDGPSVVGWLKPVILVPIGVFSGLTPAQIDGLLAHELAHILRHDFAINLLQSVCEVLFFYHPAIQAISQVIRVEREQACDDVAVALTGDPKSYAAALVKLEEARAPALVLAASGGGGLIARIRRLLAGPATPKRGFIAVSWITFAAIALAFAAILIGPGVAVRVLAAQPDPAPITTPANSPAPPVQLPPVVVSGESEFPYIINFVPYIPDGWNSPAGDEITITSVRGDRKHIELGGKYLVEGTYKLASVESMMLSVSITAPSRNSPGASSPTLPGEEGTKVSRGTGNFSLTKIMRYPGSLHVAFYPVHGGESGATMYFREVRIIVGIDKDGMISVDDQNVADEQLEPLLAQAIQRDTDMKGLIKVNDAAQWAKVMFVQDSFRKAGFTGTTLQTWKP